MVLISLLTVGIPSVCWLLSSLRKSAAIEHTAQRALTDCPPEKRAGVLRAIADLAGQLCAERVPTNLAGLLRRRPRQE
jgi:hypothetical protein